MKKLISAIIFTLLLFSCLNFTVFAETSVTISEDYQSLSLDGKTYSRVNTSVLDIEYYDVLSRQVDLSPAQQETIQEIELETNESQNIIFAYITFRDGATLSVDFLRDDYLDAYNEIVSGQASEYVIDFEWPEGNTVKAKGTDLFGDSITLTDSDLEWSDYFYVSSQSEDGTLTAVTGSLLVIEKSYYYVEFTEVAVKNWYEFYPQDYSELQAYEITDSDLLASIMDAEEKYYEDDFGFLYDDSLSRTISTVFIIFAFAIIPLISFILFLILAIRSKTIYKKFFRMISLLSLAELIVFAAVMTLITVL